MGQDSRAQRVAPVPLRTLCPAGQGDYVHFMFVFQDPYSEAEGYDRNVELSYKLPVRVEED